MPFKKGQAKVGGRKAGVPNKKTVDLRELCDAAGVEPFQVLLDLCKSRDEGVKLGAAKEAAKYLYYQRRIQELSGPGGLPIQTEVEASGQLKELLADLQTIVDTKVNERKG